MYAAFWHRRLAQLNIVFISRVASGVVGVLERSARVREADVRYVITEYGVAYLHGKTVRQRAQALISIAHPDFRSNLRAEAKKLGYL
jgi:acyl-CoA hydrolase